MLLMHGIDAYSLLSSLPLLTSHKAQGFYRGWVGEGAPAADNIVPVQSRPGVQGHGLGSRQRTCLTMVGPMYPRRLTECNTGTGWGAVVISSIKYGTHPDIRSSLSLLIGWLILDSIWISRVSNNHRAQARVGASIHSIQWYCYIK